MNQILKIDKKKHDLSVGLQINEGNYVYFKSVIVIESVNPRVDIFNI